MFEKIIKKIEKAEKIAIFNHEHPDGDALGSAFGLKLVLKALGKDAEVFLREGDETIREYMLLKGTEKSGLKLDECDLKIAVDCADKARIGDVFAEKFCGNTVAIDHHMTHVKFADTEIVVPHAPATGEIIFDLAKALQVEVTPEIAHNLYLAISCDTGSFKYSSTTAKTHMVVAELISTGINFAEIAKAVFDTNSFEYLQAYKMGIDKLEMYANGKIALLVFTDEDFNSLGIDEKMADGIVGLPRCIEGVEVGVYIRQRGENEFKVSLRSNGDTDVAKIATEFGGGGHIKASGFTLEMELNKVKSAVVRAIEKVF